MKLGLESFSVRNTGRDPIGVLAMAAEMGLKGVLFEFSPFTSYKDEDLDAVRQYAQDNGLFLEFGMGSLFRWHPMAEKGRTLLGEAGYDISVSDAEVVIHHLNAAKRLGSPLLRCVGGNLFTRDEGHDMAQLADDTVAILREACKAAEDLGLKIAMENHADFTVRELAAIHARVGSPAFGFTLDTGNLAFDMDDPMRLARIMAPHTFATHCKNYKIVRTPQGLALENCALGDGDIDIVAIAELLAETNPETNLSIEIHSQWSHFPLNLLDETYFQRHPSPPGDGLAWYLSRSWQKEIRTEWPADLQDGDESWQLEREHVTESVRWAKEKLSHILSE